MHGAWSAALSVLTYCHALACSSRLHLQDELQQVVERYSGELQALDRQCQGYYSMLVELGVGVGQGSGGGAEATASPPHPQAHRQRLGTASVGGSPRRDDGA